VEPNTAQPVPVAPPIAPAVDAAAVKPTPPPVSSKKPPMHLIILIACIIASFLMGIGFEKFHIFSWIQSLPLPRIQIVMPTPTQTPTPSVIITATVTPTATPTLSPSASPAASSSASLYTCPASGYVDCMPVLTEAKKKACAPEAMTWYKANCPTFKGGAL
jgi:hypothetical protein